MKNSLIALLVLGALGALAWFGLSGPNGRGEAPSIATWSEEDVEVVDIPEAEVVDGLDEIEAAGADRSLVESDPAAGAGSDGTPGELRLEITGRVVDEAGQPVAHASVQLQVGRSRFGRGQRARQRVRKTVETGPDGRFEFAGPGTRQSRIQLVVDHERFAPLLVDRRVDDPDGTCQVGDLVVTPGALLVGRVHDQGGQGVAGAEVELQPRDGNRLAWSSARDDVLQPATTDNLGFYRFENVMPGTYRVQATARGMQRGALRAPLRLEDGEEEEAAAIVLQPGAILSGTVFGPDGKAVRGATVRVRAPRDRGHRDRTDEDGKFEFENLPDRTLELTVEAEGFLTFTQAEIDPRNPPGGGAGMVVRLDGGLTIEGRVVDAFSGQPLARYAAKIQRLRSLDSAAQPAVARMLEECAAGWATWTPSGPARSRPGWPSGCRTWTATPSRIAGVAAAARTAAGVPAATGVPTTWARSSPEKTVSSGSRGSTRACTSSTSARPTTRSPSRPRSNFAAK